SGLHAWTVTAANKTVRASAATTENKTIRNRTSRWNENDDDDRPFPSMSPPTAEFLGKGLLSFPMGEQSRFSSILDLARHGAGLRQVRQTIPHREAVLRRLPVVLCPRIDREPQGHLRLRQGSRDDL